MDIISTSTLIGFVGDFSLQLMTHYGLGGPSGWGLKSYFRQHGKVEALFIAGGMMALFYIIYIYVLKFELNIVNLAIYGVVLDLIFRKLRLFPSLDGYYNHLNYFWSAVWGAIPMVLPYLVHQMRK
jgi:hypothetical protein